MNRNSSYILHVSDFHLKGNTENQQAKKILEVLSNKIRNKHKIDYLIYTGDIIDAKYLYSNVKNEYGISDFNKYFIFNEQERKTIINIKNITSDSDLEEVKRFIEIYKKKAKESVEAAVEVFNAFIGNLNVSKDNFFICCGNHDVLSLPTLNYKLSCDGSDELIYTPLVFLKEELKTQIKNIETEIDNCLENTNSLINEAKSLQLNETFINGLSERIKNYIDSIKKMELIEISDEESKIGFHDVEFFSENVRVFLNEINNNLKNLKDDIQKFFNLINSQSSLYVDLSDNIFDNHGMIKKKMTRVIEHDESFEDINNSSRFLPFSYFIEKMGMNNYLHPNTINFSENSNGYQTNENFENLRIFALNSQEHTYLCKTKDFNALILNTNFVSPESNKGFCVHCKSVINALEYFNKNNNENYYENKEDEIINIIIAHKPSYELCEKIRLPYHRYLNTTFMTQLHHYTKGRGIFLCGDKHTRSISSANYDNINHYLCGEPLTDIDREDYRIEYNLIEIIDRKKVGCVRKVHLWKETDEWRCKLCPTDVIINDLFEISNDYILDDAFRLLQAPYPLRNWDLFYDHIKSKKENDNQLYKNVKKYLNNLFGTIIVFKYQGKKTIKASHIMNQDDGYFKYFSDLIKEGMKQLTEPSKRKTPKINNILNIKGEYDSGKSLFLSMLYLYMLNLYSNGEIKFIPAYINLQNVTIMNNRLYRFYIRDYFGEFCRKINKIAQMENVPVFYIIDGLDEQDCWNYSSEESVGRKILDVLNEYENVGYLMSFSQNQIPWLKDTMPKVKYYDKSHVVYFNQISVNGDIVVKKEEENRFKNFLTSMLFLSDKRFQQSEEDLKIAVKITAHVIKNFKRLKVSPKFMKEHAAYLKRFICDEKIERERYNSGNVSKFNNNDIIKTNIYYIDRMHELCMDKLGYGYVNYAPAMAYYYSYQGYTYERFIDDKDSGYWHSEIRKSSDKIYKAFNLIIKNHDVREYLVALHYNAELRYYDQHLNDDINSDSILYEFMPRNISLIIRLLWKDYNKFKIVCERLVQKEDLPKCAQSVLMYILAHLKNIYSPTREVIRDKLIKKSKEMSMLKIDYEGKSDAKKLEYFLDLSVSHSAVTFDIIHNKDIKKLITLFENDNYRIFNRNFQRLYYEDACIRGEKSWRLLNPDKDEIQSGFDFHNTFYTLYTKVKEEVDYELSSYDLLTLCDIIDSRMNTDCRASIFNSTSPRHIEITTQIKSKVSDLLNSAINMYDKKDIKEIQDEIDEFVLLKCNEYKLNTILKTSIFSIYKDILNKYKIDEASKKLLLYYSIAKNVLSEKSYIYHFMKHGEEVGAESVYQYVGNAIEFSRKQMKSNSDNIRLDKNNSVYIYDSQDKLLSIIKSDGSLLTYFKLENWKDYEAKLKEDDIGNSVFTKTNCPCCNGNEITEQNEICLSCGWEYDVMQSKLDNLDFGANKYSLKKYIEIFCDKKNKNDKYLWIEAED